MFNDSPSKSENLDGFITHKYCQSILSLLFKKYNIKTFPLPLYDLDSTNVIGIHSGYFNDNIKLPLVWESCWHNVSIREQWKSCNRKFGKKSLLRIVYHLLLIILNEKVFITGGTGTIGKSFIEKYYDTYEFYSLSRE